VLRTIAGGGDELGEGGPATSAGLCAPNDVAADATGNVYVSNGGIYCSGPGGHTIRRINPDGIITTVAGTGVRGFSGDGGPATEAQLNAPTAVAVDGLGNLYIADWGNFRVRKVAPDGIISTFAGTGVRGYSGDGGPATAAQIFRFGDFGGGIAVDGEGNVYLADGGAVRKIDTSGTITTVAGTGIQGSPGEDGEPALEAAVSVIDVAVDAAGNLYLSSYDHSVVRRVDPDGRIATVAGGGRIYGAEGEPALSVGLSWPWGIAIGPDGSLFIVEHRVSVVRRVDPDGIITTVAGIRLESSGGTGRFNGEEGPATHMNLNEPAGAFVDGVGVLYVADTFNARVRAVYFED
jgi:sugar lactone lactonase YvrE